MNLRKKVAGYQLVDDATAAVDVHPLRDGRQVLVSREDLGRVLEHQWIVTRGGGGRPNYIVTLMRVKGRIKQVRMHRWLLGLSADDPMVVDHVNGEKFDNRRSNLRVATRAENSRNRRAILNSTGFKGVFRSSATRFGAKLKNRRLGTFATAKDAAAAYDAAARAAYGAFAATNADLVTA